MTCYGKCEIAVSLILSNTTLPMAAILYYAVPYITAILSLEPSALLEICNVFTSPKKLATPALNTLVHAWCCFGSVGNGSHSLKIRKITSEILV